MTSRDASDHRGDAPGTERAERRFVVYGTTGSGKTTVAAAIAERLRLPVIELDAIRHLPGWQERTADEFHDAAELYLDEYEPTGWVCDGNYSRLREDILPRVDVVVWLRPPFRVLFWRLLCRTLRRGIRGELLWGTNRERLWQQFLSRDSLLWYAVTSHRRTHRNIARDLARIDHRARVVQLRSNRDIARFLDSL